MNAADFKNLCVSNVGGTTVAGLRDSIIESEEQCHIIGGELFSLVEQMGCPVILVNFSSVEFMCSTFLGKLITLEKKAKERGARLVLCSIKREIFEVFQITRLDKLFEIHDDESGVLVNST